MIATIMSLQFADVSRRHHSDRMSTTQEEVMSLEDGHFTVPVFWSMRSPYCYISLDRCIALQRQYNLTFENPLMDTSVPVPSIE